MFKISLACVKCKVLLQKMTPDEYVGEDRDDFSDFYHKYRPSNGVSFDQVSE